MRQPAQRTVEPRRHERQLAPKRLLPIVGPAGGHVGHFLAVRLQGGVQPRRDEQPLLRLGEPLREPVHPRAEQPQRGRPVQPESAGDRLRGDLGIPVHVPACPAPEPNRGNLRGPRPFERARDLGLEPRCRIEQHGLEEEQDPTHLVLDHRTHVPERIGLPPHRQHLAQLALVSAPLGTAQSRIVEALHGPPHGLLMFEHRPTRRLGRMGGHRQSHVEPAQCLGHLGGRMLNRHARRGGQRLTLRSAGIGVVVPPPAQTLQLLGDIGQLELDRAGAHERLECAAGLGVDEPGQRAGCADVAATDPCRRIAQPEHSVAEGAALLLLEHIAEQRLEHRSVSIEGVTHGTGVHRRLGAERLTYPTYHA